ncbi:hypothetical protein Ancab_007665 [Ancistrocladus abbreviatus]
MDGFPSRSTPRKRKKASQKKRKKRTPRLKIAARSSPRQAEELPLNVPRQREITLSGNNISDGCIKNMNRVFLSNSQLDEAVEVWQRGKELGAEHPGDESEVVNKIVQLEARDRAGWEKLQKNQRKGSNGVGNSECQ